MNIFLAIYYCINRKVIFSNKKYSVSTRIVVSQTNLKGTYGRSGDVDGINDRQRILFDAMNPNMALSDFQAYFNEILQLRGVMEMVLKRNYYY